MIFSIIALSLPAMADICGPNVSFSLPMDNNAINIPVDAQFPTLLISHCGGAGEAEIRLHRVVGGESAEEIVSETGEVQVDENKLVLLIPPTDLLENTEYRIVKANENGESYFTFTTGSHGAVGMGDGIPTMTIDDLFLFRDEPNKIWMEASLITIPDSDGLSYVSIYNEADPEEAIDWELPGQNADAYVYTSFENDGDTASEFCFFTIQTDSTGAESEPSDTVCATPETVSGGLCSTAGATPALFSSLIAMLFGLRRRDG